MAQSVIRPFEPDDEERVRELAGRLQEGVAPWRSPRRVRATIQEWIGTAVAEAGAENHLLLVATDETERVVGFIVVAVQRHYIDGRDAYIGELAVDRSCERRGVASMLLAEAERWAAAQGCERLTLHTGAANAGARAFYAAHGFAEEDVSLARPLPGHT